MRKHRTALLLLAIMVACSPALQPSGLPTQPLAATGAALPWTYTDLRLLDDAGDGPPEIDIGAVYLRTTGDALWQMRLEMMDVSIHQGTDLYIFIDHAPGGSRELPFQQASQIAWDTLLVLPADGRLQVLDAQGNPRRAPALLVFRDPELDSIEITLNSHLLGGKILA